MDFKEIFGEELAGKIDAVVKEKGLNLILDNKEKPEFIPKSRFDEVIGSKNELKTQVSELTGQLEGLKKASKGNEELTKRIEELQKLNSDWENKYQDSTLTSAIKMAAVKTKAKDVDVVSLLVDKTKLKIKEDGSIEGLDEQFKTLSESKAFLFGDVTPAGSGANPAGGGNNAPKDPADMSMDEFAAAWNQRNGLTK